MKKSVLFGGLMLLASSMMAQNTIDNAFFDKVKFRGAFGTTDWTAGWANFDPQNTVYPATERTIEAGNISADALIGSPLTAAADFSKAALSNSFFSIVDYIGAFGKTDWTAGWSNFDPQNTSYPATTVTVNAGDITSNTTWTKGNVYLLNGWVYVKSGATLTIEAGTVIRGDKTNKGALIIEKGAKIIANGTASEPIVFTSNQPAGSRTYGDWGGVIICGQAPINPAGGSATIEGGVGSTYGGNISDDNSGNLQYVRIEFPGIAFATNNEINGLTMGGVGSGTTIDNIQVSYSGDDSYEWFGGNVNCKHLIAFRGWDDDFDTDFGYSGMVQFGVSLRDPQVADQSKSNSFESDNDASGSSNSPFTSAVFCNMSSFGPLATPSTSINSLYQAAMHIRRNSKLKIFNSVFAGWPKGLIVDGAACQTSAANGDLALNNVIMSGMTTNYAPTTPWIASDEQTWFETAAFNNKTYTDNSSLAISDPFNLTAPKFTTVYSYLLNGWAYVKSGATLTIKPGVVIRGDKTNKGALIVEKGAKLIANGTATEPIVFTSNQAAGSRTYGDWGGLILCGKAPINPAGGSATIEGGVGSTYGGTDAADNSGSLKAVRIEFPGIAFAPNNEINGLTLGGVGSATTIDSVQVSYSGDDSFEWFGGTVNAKHLIAFRGWDDDFDTDFGYSGMVQYAVALRDPAVADQSKSNSFESDNDASGSTNSPYTSAVFSNVSSFGPLATSSTAINSLYQAGMHIRRNSKLQVHNSVFAGWPKGLIIDGAASQNNAISGDLKIRNSVLSGMTALFVPTTNTWTSANDERTWYNTYSFKNDTVVANSDLKIADAFNLTAPNFLPTASSKMNQQSYWYYKSATGLANNMQIVAKAYANGSQVTAQGSMLLAYKNGVCQGSVSINNTSKLFIMTVGSDLASDTDFELKLYDAATRKLYHLPASFDFTAMGAYGTVPAPVELNATASLNIPLNKNSNWVSFNVLPENNSLVNVLNYNVKNEDVITSQTETATYYDGVWYGMNEISKDKLYVLNCTNSAPGSIQISNQPMVKNSPVAIQQGYNWLGYSLLNSYDIATAFNGISINDGDYIITSAEKGGSAAYYGGAWYGSEDYYMMTPGVGYVLSSSTSSTFNYPKNTVTSTVRSASTTSAANVWTSEVGQRYAMPVFAQVYKNNELFQSEGLQLAVFKDGLCQGVTSLTNGPKGKLNILTVGSDVESVSGLECKVYDPSTSTYYNVEETINFQSLQALGSISAPVALHVSNATTGVDQASNVAPFAVYPTMIESEFNISLNSASANASVALYNVQGKLVKNIFNGVVEGSKQINVVRDANIVNGLYLIKATISGNQFIQKVFFK